MNLRSLEELSMSNLNKTDTLIEAVNSLLRERMLYKALWL
jgi:hypothetical protein